MPSILILISVGLLPLLLLDAPYNDYYDAINNEIKSQVRVVCMAECDWLWCCADGGDSLRVDTWRLLSNIPLADSYSKKITNYCMWLALDLHNLHEKQQHCYIDPSWHLHYHCALCNTRAWKGLADSSSILNFTRTLREMHLFTGITSDPLRSCLAPPTDRGSECSNDVPWVCFNSLNLDEERLPIAGNTANIPSSLPPSSLETPCTPILSALDDLRVDPSINCSSDLCLVGWPAATGAPL